MTTEDTDTNGAGNDDQEMERHVLLTVLGDHPKTKTLTVFLDNPDMEFNLTEIADYAGLKRDTVSTYLNTLRAWGLVEETQQVGNNQLYSLDTASEAAESLAKFEWDLVKHLADKEQSGDVDDMNNPLS